MTTYKQRSLAGKCVGCGKVAPVPGKARCVPCADEINKYNAARVKQAIKDGLCLRCKKAPAVKGNRCEPCRQKQKKAKKRHTEGHRKPPRTVQSIETIVSDADRTAERRKALIVNVVKRHDGLTPIEIATLTKIPVTSCGRLIGKCEGIERGTDRLWRQESIDLPDRPVVAQAGSRPWWHFDGGYAVLPRKEVK